MKIQHDIAIMHAKSIALLEGTSHHADTFNLRHAIGKAIGIEIDLDDLRVCRTPNEYSKDVDVEKLASIIEAKFEGKFSRLVEPPVVDLSQSINDVPCTPDMKVLVDHDDADLLAELEEMFVEGDFTIVNYTEGKAQRIPIGPLKKGEGVSLWALAKFVHEHVSHWNWDDNSK